MKIKQICTLLLLLLVGIPMMQAQTFDELWKDVERAEKKSLPQTVVKLADQIFLKGEREKNSPQMLKAYMWRMQYQDELTPDSFYVSLGGLEQWVKKADKPMNRAILHSLIAGIYADYAANNRWQINQRTEIVNQTPSDDMREWTANMFIDKVRIHTREALTDSLDLLKTSSRTYIPFVALGETSEYYHHDMYHLLASRGIKALEQIEYLEKGENKEVKQNINRIYQHMLSAYQARDEKDGYVLTSLEYLRWKQYNEPDFRPFRAKKGLLGLTQDPYLAGLDKLRADFKSLDVCAEIYLAKAEFAQMNNQLVAALQLCDEAIRLYPDYRRINALKNFRTNILAPILDVNMSQTAFPGEELKLRTGHRNLDGFTLRLYQAKKLISEQHYSLLRSKDYAIQDTTFTFKTPTVGTYVMRIVPDAGVDKVVENNLYVTRFKVLISSLPHEKCEIVALDAQTGHPISGAQITLLGNDEKVKKTFTTDEAGIVTINRLSDDFHFLKATKGRDIAMPNQRIYAGSYNSYGNVEMLAAQTTLLTDRALYRPGQTVYVKGIVYYKGEGSASVCENFPCTVVLTDANGQEVGTKKLETNEFGSFTTDFVLPSVCLNGVFELKAQDGRTSIRVEDYKQPTFDITFDKQTGSYQLGDKVQVKGQVQSYNGVFLQNLPVKYKVTRSAFDFWRFQGNTEIASGEVMLGENGNFTIPVLLEENEDYKHNDRIYYRYQIETIVTNVAGETQSSVDLISAGKRSLIVQAELPEKTRKDELVSMLFKVQNLNGQPVKTDGTYRLYRAKDQELKQPEATPVATGAFESNKEMKLDWKNLPSGGYILKMSVKDSQGLEVTADAKTILFSLADKRPPVTTPVWIYEENIQFDATHPGVFYFGTSEKDAYVMVNAYCDNQLVESKVLILNDTIVRFEYPYRMNYGDGIAVNFCMVRNGQVYQENVKLEERLPNTALTMKWEVFRDKLRPGQKEEWKLTIRTPDGEAADAEMLAMMYDASLDQIWSRPQGFRLSYRRMVSGMNWMNSYNDMNSFSNWWNRKMLKVPEMKYDYFVIPQEGGYNQEQMSVSIADSKGNGVSYGSGNIMVRGTAKMRSSMEVAPSAMTNVGFLSQVEDKMDAGEELLPAAPSGLRTELAETAFFYPQLRTNKQGEIVFSFTTPESLTKWNFRGYSHTKNMMTGTLDGEVTVSKEFMLTPNLPRFVRVGDKTSIAASIVNLTGALRDGTVTLTLFDPITEQVVSTQKQKFSVEAGKTIGVNFMFTASDKYSVLGCRMMAESNSFSDGEQQLLPVLSNKEHLVETLPMPIRGEETRTFSLDDLFNHHNRTATDRQLTIEFTGNPAWYAIQALPSLNLPTNNNAISWATTYYANTLASYIMNSQPRIKAVFDSWKLQGGTKDTFMSNLQKNQEVKNIILSESPWVLEAQTEEQQKERIATLFDLNNIRINNIAALTRLQELQDSDGSWSWYKGMSSSLYVTTYIAELNARLAMLTGQKLDATALILQQKAFIYLHQAAAKELAAMLKEQKEGNKPTDLSGNMLQYLYLTAISGEQLPGANKSLYTYFLYPQLPRLLASSSMSRKAQIAIILDKAGRKKESQEFIASLKQHLAKTDEGGMYFAFNENPYSWGGTQLQAHVDVMEALEMVGGNSEAVEEMKLWLLKQKQTQQWNSPVATADAVYALLMKGINLLDNQGDVRLTIANEVLETVSPAKTTVPGLGYVKRSFTQKEVVNARTITVEKRNPGIAWGAVYAAYESPISDVKQQGGELNVQKQLYVERTVNNAAQLQPITNKTTLQVGDKVVSRLTIRLDRTMDFVQLKDQRGACFEPIGSISGYRWNNGFGYYVDVKDASTNFFFDHLGKGVYVLEHSYRVSRVGTYEAGLATMQSAYAPEYTSHSGAMRVEVK